jgi:threonine dehydratase
MIGVVDIQQAAVRIADHTSRTPLVYAHGLSEELGCRLWLKCENLQPTGSFKDRGASNAVFSLSADQAAAGVLTHSSGNHAAALARAARLRGIAARVVMPDNASAVKRANAARHGAVITSCGPRAEDREQVAAQLASETGAHLVPPFDDWRVIAGQGTVGLEIVAQLPGVRAIVAPVGGGGLLAGLLTAVKAMASETLVYAAEPAWADDTFRSLHSRQRQPALRFDTVADGVRVPVGELTFPIIQRLVDDVLLASEEAIADLTRRLARSAKIVAEPTGALSVAAIAEHRERFAGQDVVAVISGGNLDFANFSLVQ